MLEKRKLKNLANVTPACITSTPALLCSNTLPVTTVCPYDFSGLSDVMDAL